MQDVPSSLPTLTCLVDEADAAAAALPVATLRPAAVAPWLDSLPEAQARFVRGSGFAGRVGSLVLLPGESGVAGAAWGLGAVQGPDAWGGLAPALPAGLWRLAEPSADALLGFCLGAYRFDRLKSSPAAAAARLVAPAGHDATRRMAAAIWLVRDLVNLPANLLGPAELAESALAIGRSLGAEGDIIAGEAVALRYPAVQAVGRASARGPRVALLRWRGTAADAAAPLLSICGKGVCFDTGGYDLKPSAGMLQMKKDMGGAAHALALACLVIGADLPIRLELRLGCVENMISGDAMRPRDVLRTRRGLTVEIGNTDAEGRLVLCDLLDEAGAAEPRLLLDFATLTGAARVALGPDVAVFFTNSDHIGAITTQCAGEVQDPVWRLPLWPGYESWLESPVADLATVAARPQAGAIVAGLFLQHFVRDGQDWLHFDINAANDQARPGHPLGGEAHGLRAAFASVLRIIHLPR